MTLGDTRSDQMKATIYIETSIIGYLTARVPLDPIVAGQMEATRKWWREVRHQFDLFTSEFVLLEASRGDPQAAAERMAVLIDLALVPVPAEVDALADSLLARGALPLKARVDATHLAVAATNGLDYLLTWNCRHLANASLRTRIEQACREHGFEPPIICTPYELAEV